MRAAVYKGEQVLQVEDIPDPAPAAGQVVMLSIALELMRTGRVSVDDMLNATNFVPLEGIQGAFELLCQPTSELQMVVEL